MAGLNRLALERVMQRLQKFATNPRRAAMIEQVEPDLQALLDSEDAPKRIWLHGSFASKKPNPKDIDIIPKYSSEEAVDTALDRVWGNREGSDLLDTSFGFGPSRLEQVKEGTDKTLRPAVQEGKQRYGSDYKWYRLLGLGGALTGADQLMSQEDAEAFPIGKVLKAGARKMSGVRSSASDVLEGYVIGGRKIAEVQKGRGNQRLIVFEDGSTQPATTDYITSLSRSVGTERYTGSFMTKAEAPEAQLTQALKSAEMHFSRSAPMPGVTKEMARTQHEEYLKQVKEAGGAVPDTVFGEYKGRYITLPRVYAELLEKEGYFKTSQTKREKQILKRYRSE